MRLGGPRVNGTIAFSASARKLPGNVTHIGIKRYVVPSLEPSKMENISGGRSGDCPRATARSNSVMRSSEELMSAGR